MIKTFVFKLYHSARNRYLHRQINAAGLTWNHCVALHKRYYKLYHKTLNLYRLQAHLAKIKYLPCFSYLLEYGSQAVQNVAERITKGYKKFFDDKKRGLRCSPPKFKKVARYKSFTLKQCGWKLLDGNRLRINNRIYKFWKSRDIEGRVKTLTIKRDSLGDIYIYFACEIDKSEIELRSGKSVGFDFGMKKFLTSSIDEDHDIKAPLFFNRSAKAVRKANQQFSRKQKGSSNYKRARLNLSRKHRKIANQRHDFHFKTANDMCREYAIMCFEDLSLKGMAHKHGKKIGDYGFYSFLQILDFQARYKFGSKVVKIDRFYPSSQICSKCGFKNPTVKDLKIREWDCPQCGTHHDRDRNAAINIERQGIVSLGVGDVRPEAIQADPV